MAYPVYEDNGGLVSVVNSSIAVTYPSTVNSGDILIAQLIIGSAISEWTTPSGWTKIGDVFYAGTAGLLYAVFWKRADGTEIGTQTFINNTSDTLAGVISRYSGCILSGSPIEGPAFNSDRTVTEYALYDFEALTTLGAERLGLILLGVSNDQESLPPLDWTELFDYTSLFGTDSAIAASAIELATAQTLPANSGALSRFNSYGNVIFALIPPSGGSTVPFSANSIGSTLFEASLKLIQKISANSVGSSFVSANLKVIQKFTVSSSGNTQITANFKIIRKFTAGVNGSSLVSVEFKVFRTFVADLSGSTLVLANIKAIRKFTASIDGSTLAVSDIKVVRNFVADSFGDTQVSVNIKLVKKFTASVLGSTLVDANLINGISSDFSAVVNGSSLVSVEIKVIRKFTAQVNGSSQVQIVFFEEILFYQEIFGNSFITRSISEESIITNSISANSIISREIISESE